MCTVIKRNGQPCGNHARPGGRVCWKHGAAAPQVGRRADERAILAQLLTASNRPPWEVIVEYAYATSMVFQQLRDRPGGAVDRDERMAMVDASMQAARAVNLAVATDPILAEQVWKLVLKHARAELTAGSERVPPDRERPGQGDGAGSRRSETTAADAAGPTAPAGAPPLGDQDGEAPTSAERQGSAGTTDRQSPSAASTDAADRSDAEPAEDASGGHLRPRVREDGQPTRPPRAIPERWVVPGRTSNPRTQSIVPRAWR
jgi:hypothetical protein